MQAQTSGLPGMVQLLLEHISQHLCSEKVISAQEIAAFASGLDNIQNIYAEIAERYSEIQHQVG
jgi:hypothetical protein